jgi:hypothetical protein
MKAHSLVINVIAYKHKNEESQQTHYKHRLVLWVTVEGLEARHYGRLSGRWDNY